MKHLALTAFISIFIPAFLAVVLPNVASGCLVTAGTELSSSQARGEIAAANSRPYQEKSGAAAASVSKHGSAASSASETAKGLSVADILGIFFFLALVGTHFCFCRKGIYPDSVPLCERLSRPKTKAARGNSKAD